MEAWKIDGYEPSCKEIGGGARLSITINLALLLGNHVDQPGVTATFRTPSRPQVPHMHALRKLVAAHPFDEADSAYETTVAGGSLVTPLNSQLDHSSAPAVPASIISLANVTRERCVRRVPGVPSNLPGGDSCQGLARYEPSSQTVTGVVALIETNVGHAPRYAPCSLRWALSPAAARALASSASVIGVGHDARPSANELSPLPPRRKLDSAAGLAMVLALAFRSHPWRGGRERTSSRLAGFGNRDAGIPIGKDIDAPIEMGAAEFPAPQESPNTWARKIFA